MPYKTKFTPKVKFIPKVKLNNLAKKSLTRSNGFTLVELVIGIVVLSLSFTVIFSMIVPSATQSALQINQIRASELGKSMLSEIMGKSFDENSDRVSGVLRCGEDINADDVIDSDDACSTVMGHEGGDEAGGDRSSFDDVDDYNGLTSIDNSLGGSLNELYSGFTLLVNVCNDSQYDGNCNNGGDNTTAKFIVVTVTTPTGNEVSFSSYRSNF